MNSTGHAAIARNGYSNGRVGVCVALRTNTTPTGRGFGRAKCHNKRLMLEAWRKCWVFPVQALTA